VKHEQCRCRQRNARQHHKCKDDECGAPHADTVRARASRRNRSLPQSLRLRQDRQGPEVIREMSVQARLVLITILGSIGRAA
jgi:hypothetical protein